MSNIKELLHWRLLFTVFRTNGKKLITHETKSVFNENINSLKIIASQQSTSSEIPKVELTEEVYLKFKDLQDKPNEILLNSFSKREVRLLVWSLDFKDKDSILLSKQFSKFISLINEYWRDSYIIPLWYILLKNWNTLTLNKSRFSEYVEVLKSKCDAYDKSRRDVLAIKSHFDFWKNTNGVDLFVNVMISNNIHMSNVCQSLNLNANFIGTGYYYESFLLYLKRVKEANINNDLVAETVLEIRGIQETKYKLLYLSVLLIYPKFKSEISEIKRAAFDIIGDPIVKRHWENKHLNEEEAELVENARKRLMVLMNKKFIKLFFSKLVQDPRRETYWLKFIDDIEDIKFIGNTLNYKILKNNQEISKYVDARYTITRSNQSTSALIFWAKDYVFVEFSDTGSVYVYRKESFNIRLNYVERISDLKKWPRGMSIVKNEGQYYSLRSEGTLIHSGSWESRLDVWMRKYFYN